MTHQSIREDNDDTFKIQENLIKCNSVKEIESHIVWRWNV